MYKRGHHPRSGDKAGWTIGQLATAHNGPDAPHLPTKEGAAPASRLTGSPEIASAQPEGHPSCPTKTRTKAVSTAASPTRSVGTRAFLCWAPQAQAQGFLSGSHLGSTESSLHCLQGQPGGGGTLGWRRGSHGEESMDPSSGHPRALVSACAALGLSLGSGERGVGDQGLGLVWAVRDTSLWEVTAKYTA